MVEEVKKVTADFGFDHLCYFETEFKKLIHLHNDRIKIVKNTIQGETDTKVNISLPSSSRGRNDPREESIIY